MRDSPFLTILLVVAVVAAGLKGGWDLLQSTVREEVARAVSELRVPDNAGPAPTCTPTPCPTCVATPCPASPSPSPSPSPEPIPVPTPTPTPTNCKGMTWQVLEARDGIVLVGSAGDAAQGGTDAYHGDTPCSESLPLLCLRKEQLPQPTGTGADYYSGWTGGTVRLTPPVVGATLTSRAVADAMCERAFGPGYRMGEHHDGGGGWRWWARGSLQPGPQKIWATVNDQPSSPWHHGASGQQ